MHSLEPSPPARARTAPGIARTSLAIFCGAAVSVSIAGCGPSGPGGCTAQADPVVDGRPVSDWVAEYDPDLDVPEGTARSKSGSSLGWEGNSRLRWETSARAKKAIRAAGTNAIPLFLDYLWRQDDVVTGNLKAVFQRQTSYDFNNRGEAGLIALGELAAPAVPSLNTLAGLPSGGPSLGGWSPRPEQAANVLKAIAEATAAQRTNPPPATNGPVQPSPSAAR